MDGLEAVTDVGQRPIQNDRHRVVDERLAHVIFNGKIDDLRGVTHLQDPVRSPSDDVDPKPPRSVAADAAATLEELSVEARQVAEERVPPTFVPSAAILTEIDGRAAES